MRRGKKNRKLDKFGELAKQIEALGFESVIVIASEKNHGEGGKTFLSTKHTDKDYEPKFEKNIIKLLGIVGVTPSEIEETLKSLMLLSEAGNLHAINQMLHNLHADLARLTEEEEEEEEKPKKKRKKSKFESAIMEHAEQRAEDEINSFMASLPSFGTRHRRITRQEELAAEVKLSPEDRIKLNEIRERKNRLVHERNYEAAARARDEERELLGLNGGRPGWTLINHGQEETAET